MCGRCSCRCRPASSLHGLPQSLRLQSHPNWLGHYHLHRHVTWIALYTPSPARISQTAAPIDERLRVCKETTLSDHAHRNYGPSGCSLRTKSVSSYLWRRLWTFCYRSGYVGQPPEPGPGDRTAITRMACVSLTMVFTIHARFC